MRRIFRLTLLFTLFLTLEAVARHSDTTRYAYPILNVERYYAANFGEIRPGHFHAGVDIKTANQEGKPIVAIADGYIERITEEVYGYGKGLYLRLDTGEQAVYGHLKGFARPLADTVLKARYERQVNHLDLRFSPTQWRVKRGDVIAYSGNTGSSMGPHLHFEIHTAQENKNLNLVKQGIIRPKDNIRPQIRRLHYVEIDSLEGVCVRSVRQTYGVERIEEGRYGIAPRRSVGVGRKGYFIVEVTDRKDEVHNHFGIWRVEAKMDGQPFFEYRMDGFTPDLSRYSDVVSCYEMQIHSRNEVILMAQFEGQSPTFYPTMLNRGVIEVGEGERHTISLEVEDDSGNRSTMTFDIEGQASEFRAPQKPQRILKAQLGGDIVYDQRLTVHIPKDALFESKFVACDTLQVRKHHRGVKVLSPAMRILDKETPMKKSATISLRTEIPNHLKLQALLARYSPRKGLRAVGGRYDWAMQGITARSRILDWFVVVADTLAPKIRPRFQSGADMSGYKELRFSISDNFSGIGCVELYIDGKWVPADRLPYKGILYHRFDTPLRGRKHHVKLIVSDAVGNTSTWEGSFRR